MTATDTCETCGHAVDPHVLLTLDPMTGGIRRCPEDDCDCFATWSPDGVPVPDDEVIAALQEVWVEGRLDFISHHHAHTQPAPGILPLGESWLK